MRLLIITLSLFISIIFADQTNYCNETVSCPEETPCCSASTGVCGTGSYCLECNPRFSFNISACMPPPICKDSKTTFTTDIVGDYNSYLGNASEMDWIYSGYLMDYDEGMIMAMPNQTGGTVLYSTRYMWYGKATARFRSSRGQGVVSAFILYSDAQDEIDFEFVGADLYKVQTNFYYEGILNYTNSRNITTNNTFEYFHEYTIDWTEDEITWSVNGVVGRTLRREDTYNETSGEYMFPQTPSRVELSLWPGGDLDNAIGTINWAGGEIDWNAEDLVDPGYLYTVLDSIEIECYDPPLDTLITGDTCYVYNSSDDFSEKSIMITDDRTWLGSLAATGLDQDYGAEDEDDDDDDDETTILSYSETVVTSHQVSSVVTTNSQGSTTTEVSTRTHVQTSTHSRSASTNVPTGFVQDTSASTSTSTGIANVVSASTFITSVALILLSLLI